MNQKPSLQTTFAGLTLRNPFIVGSSGLTDTPEKVAALEKAGAGAVVLKSLFEEQILESANQLDTSDYPEAADYLQAYISSHQIEKYLTLIREAKAKCAIPVIASINCYKASSWTDFAAEMEKAGADAIEINIMYINAEFDAPCGAFDQRFIQILKQVKKTVSIPVIVKLSKQCGNIAGTVNQLYANGANAVVLFNRHRQPEINIEKMEFCNGPVFSCPADFGDTLRWTGIISGKLPRLSLAASGGVHEPEALIKALLAGASAAEICSSIYQTGNDFIGKTLEALEAWMAKHQFCKVEDFRGRLSYKGNNLSEYERVQFMKYYSSKE